MACAAFDEEIQEDLCEPCLVRQHARRSVEAAHDPGAMADLVVRHLERGLDDLAKVGRCTMVFVDPRERAPVPYDDLDARNADARVVERFDERRVAGIGALRKRTADDVDVSGDV